MAIDKDSIMNNHIQFIKGEKIVCIDKWIGVEDLSKFDTKIVEIILRVCPDIGIWTVGKEYAIESILRDVEGGTDYYIIRDDKEKEKFLKELAKKTEGHTGADLESLAREAAMLSLREDIKSELVSKKNFDAAFEKIKPSVTKETISAYKKLEENFIKSAKAAVPTAAYLK